MGEYGRAVASLWLEHAPSIGLAIGPRQTCHLVELYFWRRMQILGILARLGKFARTARLLFKKP